MKRIYTFAIVVLLMACGEQSEQLSNGFDQFKDDFINALWKTYPNWASREGFHEYDSELPIPDEKRRKEQLEFANHWSNRLNEFDIASLKNSDQVDYHLIENYLKRIFFNINELKSWQWNPSAYNLGGSFFQLINYTDKPLSERVRLASQKLNKVEEYYQAAKRNIKNPSLVHTELAIQQLEGSKSIFEKNLIDSLENSDIDEAFKTDFRTKIEKAVNAIEQFKTFLEVEILPDLPKEDESFRIGKELFEKKFQLEIQSDYTAEEIFKIAVEEKQKLHDNLYRLSDILWEDYFDIERPGNRLDQIRMVIDEVSNKHVHRDSFITTIRQQIPELESFVIANDLISLDPEKPLIVRETPKYMRGFAGASISAPGPYDKDAETFYNVTPLDHYTEEEAESYLREYNNYTLQILNIHEAIPGHYTQLVYSNKSSSIIKSILGSGTMVEGWAVYAEKMMLENGYGQEMELGLMYYKWNLRSVCNTILDYGVHVLNYTEKDAMQLLQKEAFQEESEAEGKWRRARLSQVQLCSYFTGFYEIMALREEMQEGNSEFSLKEFHENFLSYGSAPIRYIKKMMLGKTNEKKESSPAI